jgi:hypothetical protein
VGGTGSAQASKTGRRRALYFSERRPCGDGLVEVLVVLASAPEPKLRDVV